MAFWRISNKSLSLLLLLASVSTWVNAAEWQLARSDKTRDIRVYVRVVPGQEYKAFYAVTHVDARLTSVVALLSDVAAMPEWIARLQSAQTLRRDGNTQLWVKTVYRLPYPFLPREAVLHSRFRQDKSGVVDIETRAVPMSGGKQSSQRVQLTQMQSTWRLTREKDQRIRVELWGQGDPGGYVPPVLFNYNLPDEPAQTLRNFRKMLQRDKYQKANLSFVKEMPAAKQR